MSLLVRYTLKDASDNDHQARAMLDLVAGLRAEGVSGVSYSCFSTDDPTRFFGVLEYGDDQGKQAFQNSSAFAAYKASGGPTFANPPEATEIAAIASTLD